MHSLQAHQNAHAAKTTTATLMACPESADLARARGSERAQDTLRYAALRCATLRYAALRCATLRYAALRCATLRVSAAASHFNLDSFDSALPVCSPGARSFFVFVASCTVLSVLCECSASFGV